GRVDHRPLQDRTGPQPGTMAWTRRPRTSSPWNGSTGSTTGGSSTNSAASHPPNTRSTTTFKPSQTVRSTLTRSSLHETRGGSPAASQQAFLLHSRCPQTPNGTSPEKRGRLITQSIRHPRPCSADTKRAVGAIRTPGDLSHPAGTLAG